jgi:ribosomal protein S18 acetylase RimI-like enzyme
VNIRRATSGDWEASRDIRLRALADSPDAFMSTLDVESRFDDGVWIARLRSSYTAFAVDGGEVVGVAALIDDPHEQGSREIVAMWVEPAFRGRGIAGALVGHLVQEARRQGVSAVALWVADGNDRAQRVYARRGFEATGQRDVIRAGLGEERMRLTLS